MFLSCWIQLHVHIMTNVYDACFGRHLFYPVRSRDAYSSWTLCQNVQHCSCPSLEPNYTRSRFSIRSLSQHFYCYFKAIVCEWLGSILDWSTSSGGLTLSWYLKPALVTASLKKYTDKKMHRYLYGFFYEAASVKLLRLEKQVRKTAQVRKTGHKEVIFICSY